MNNFDRGFESVIVPLALIALMIVTLLHACEAYCTELPPVPVGRTVTLEGHKHECFETEEFRTVVQYVKVIAPELYEQNEKLRLMLSFKEDEIQAFEFQVQALEGKVAALGVDITASRAELDDYRLQAKTWKSESARATVLHYVIHGVALVTVVVLGGALIAEKVHD